MNYLRLTNQLHQTALDKGWHDVPRETGTMIGLCHSEICEASQARLAGFQMDDHLPEFDAVSVELADCAIRLFDMAGKQNLRLRWIDYSKEAEKSTTLLDRLDALHNALAMVMEMDRIGELYGIEDAMSKAIFLLSDTMINIPYDNKVTLNLLDVITAKDTYNKSREYRHGGKAF